MVLQMRVTQGVGFKHHHLVVALVVLVLGVVRNPALGCDLARAFRRVELVGVLRLSLVLIVVPHWGLPLREAARDAARAEVAPVGQVVEPHLGLLRVEASTATAFSHFEHRAALIVRGCGRWPLGLVSSGRAHA